MIALCDRFVAGVERRDRRSAASRGRSCSSARGRSSRSRPSRRGPAARAPRCTTPALEDFLHLFLLNRGVLITPFHNMALMSPATTAADVDRHTEVFAEAVDALAGAAPRVARASS